jgi:adenylosuccinate synthase
MDKVEKKEKLMKEREEKEKIRTQLKQEKLEQKNKIKKFIKNTVVNQTINIGEFNEPVESLEQVQLVTKCPAILKSGAKKGEQCGSNIKHNGFCLRHCVIIKE